MAHSHSSDVDVHVPRRTRRNLAVLAAALGVATLLAVIALWPGDIDSESEFLADAQYSAEVVGVELAACAGTEQGGGVECEVITYRLTQGPDSGEERSFEFAVGAGNPSLSPGDEIVLDYYADVEEDFEYSYADRQRRPVLIGLAIAFAVAVVALGRWRGLSALVGLVASLVVILVFVLPAILNGTSPVLVAVVGTAAIAFVALYLAHGFNAMTTVALLGTIAALALTALLSWLFTELAQFSGRGNEDAVIVDLLSGGVDLSGLVLAGVVIGALGALDDMTVTQASSVAELRAADPTMSRRHLNTRGLRIGRDHVASTVNTLALAYVGTSLPTMLLLVMSDRSLGAVANGEIVAIEIVRTLVGSIGLVASVPITTWLAAKVVPGPVSETGAGMPGGEDNRDPDRTRVDGGGTASRESDGGPNQSGSRRPPDDPNETFWKR